MIEVLVAISVLLIGTTGATAVLSSAIRSGQSARLNLIGAQLAQEGVELVRKVRDGNFIVNADMGAQIPAGISRIDWKSAANAPGNQFLAPGTGVPLRYDPLYGYNYSVGITTSFEREVNITSVPDGFGNTRELIVSVTMKWNDRGAQKSFVVEDHLFNWH